MVGAPEWKCQKKKPLLSPFQVRVVVADEIGPVGRDIPQPRDTVPEFDPVVSLVGFCKNEFAFLDSVVLVGSGDPSN